MRKIHYMVRSLLTKLIGGREPDLFIGGRDKPYLLRWYVIPRNKFFNIYYHRFMQSDTAEALHDHPWLFNMSYLLLGEYTEFVPLNGEPLLSTPILRNEGAIKFRWGKSPHRVELYRRAKAVAPDDDVTPITITNIEIPVDTLFITGPIVRKWGFYCPKGWKPWEQFLDRYDSPRENIRSEGCG